jgi:phosphoglycerate dehydrogenase-like enzyme
MSDGRIRTVYMQQFEKDDWLPLSARHKDIALSVIKTADDLAQVIDDCEIMIANNRVCNEPIGRLMLERGKAIRLIQFSTAGIERGVRFGLPPVVPVCNVPGVKGPTVAEHAMLLLLASFRRFRDIEAARASREWIREQLHETARTLEGATLVIAGLGSIGREAARKAKAFDMRVIAVTRAGTVGPTIDEVVTRERLHEVLPRADAVVLCLPVEPGTIGFIGEAELALMKRDAILINVGRGELVDEAALIGALDRNRIGGAALDVTVVEPLPADSRLWEFDNVLISPHVAGTGKNGAEVFDAVFTENLSRYRSGRPLIHQVEWQRDAALA